MTIGQRLFRKKVRPIDGYAWIGLDFGTATTECVVRIEASGVEDRVAVLAFDGSSRGDAGIVLPSAMELRGGKLVPAYELSGRGTVLQHLKAQLLTDCLGSKVPSRLQPPDGPYCMTMLHMASVLYRARKAIHAWTGGKRLRYYLNVAAPVGARSNDPRDSRVRNVFAEVAFRALELSSKWPTRALSDAVVSDLIATGLSLTVPEQGQSPVTAVSEALAAVISFLHSPNRTAGNYATIDIGGGSTDLSFFWYQTGQYHPNGERKVWYYSVQSASVGTTDLMQDLPSQTGLGSGRTSHERFQAMRDPEHALTPGRRSGFLAQIDDAYRESFREAFRLRPIHKDWCRDGSASWTLLLLGGGCGFPFVKAHLKDSPPKNANILKHGRIESLSAPRRLEILLPDGRTLPYGTVYGFLGKRDVLESNAHLCTVAHGLAFRAPDIPQWGQEAPVARRPLPPAWEPPEHTVHN